LESFSKLVLHDYKLHDELMALFHLLRNILSHEMIKLSEMITVVIMTVENSPDIVNIGIIYFSMHINISIFNVKHPRNS
jgi:hypothetical protein